MVQEKLVSFSTQGATYQQTKNEKASVAASISKQPSTSKSVSNKYGAWGPVYKDKQNFIDMHQF